MRPSRRKFQDVVIQHLGNCPVTKANIAAADDIFGKNLGSLKGKTAQQSNIHEEGGVDALPLEVVWLSIAIDIMFINKVPFFIALSCKIKFGTVESLPNRQIATVKICFRQVIQLYCCCRLIVGSILADIEFQPIRPWFPFLNTAAANEHVPKFEQYIHTVNDRTRSTYTMLPYCHLPRIALIHLVKNAVFCLNAFLTDNGVSKKS
jgi:hypothetical protein